MRPASRLFAALSQSTSKYLTPYAPTGLTGIYTHPYPRPQLLYIYTSTLDKLSRLPRDSVYRQSTEALTRHRLAIIETETPAGFDAWQQHIERDVFPNLTSGQMKVAGDIKHLSVGGKPYLFQRYEKQEQDDRVEEYDGEVNLGELGEGIRSASQRTKQVKAWERGIMQAEAGKGEQIMNEPGLTREQIGRLEEKLESGLIEEVIMVAQKEHDLVDIMLENKMYVLGVLAWGLSSC